MLNRKPIKPGRNPLANYGKYSAMAFQMGLIIAAGAYGGTLLDDLVKIKFPVFTIILSLAAVAGAIWLMIKELSNTNNN